MNAFVPTHRVPPSGMDSWPRPDPAVAAGPHIDGGLEVQIVDRVGDWAKVAFNNGWTAWVDGRLLAGLRRSNTPGLAALMADRTKAFAVGGGFLIVLSSLLPWLRGGTSGNAFDVPIKFLVDYKSASNGGIKLGWVLVVCAVVIVGAVVANADQRIVRGAGIAAIAIAALYAIQLNRLVSAVPGASLTDFIGFGVLATAACGVLVLFSHKLGTKAR